MATAANAQVTTLKYPVTKKVDQVDTYFGTKVSDPYRWLENTDSADVKEWVLEQNKVTNNYLSAIPFRSKIKSRLEQIWNYPRYTQPAKVGNHYFFYKNDGLQNQAVLYIQDGLNGTPRVFIDPNKLSSDGTVALGTVSYSRDNKYAAYAVQSSGSDWQEIHVKDIASGNDTKDLIKWVKFSGISWFKDGFFYSGYDAPASGTYTAKNEYHKVYYHKLGTDQSQDQLIFEDKEHPQRLMGAYTTEDERYIFLDISEGGKKGSLLYYKDAMKPSDIFHPIISEFGYDNGVIETEGNQVIMLTNNGAPKRRIVMFDPAKPEQSNWKTIIAEREETLEDANYVSGKLIVTYLKDASTHAYVYNLNGKLENEIKLPTLGSAGGFGGRKNETTVFYSFTSFTYPRTIYRYDVATKTSTVFRKTDVPVSLDGYETKQIFYKSKDGTKVPMFIIHKKGLKMDGTNPTYMSAYGGFNISTTPYFSTPLMVLLENNCVLAFPNLRGGGEYGEKWHEAGMKQNKQNVFYDFVAAAEYLFNEKYTNPNRLAIQGGSNGGLLIGAVINQRPDICKVAFPAVGVMDMLRFHKFTIGWGWVSEYGSSDDSTDFYNLIKYSPLHNIREGVNYPATLVTTADHDDRVVPGHSFKYAATLQEKYKGNNPVLIRIETKAGHGGGKPTSKIIEELADEYSFMFYNMGIQPKY